MDEKKIVGIRRDRFLNTIEEHLGIIDFDILNKTYDKMLAERKTMGEFFTFILVNYIQNAPGVYGDYNTGDIDHLIGEFEKIIQELKIKKNNLKGGK
ncbi:hypothetical protein LCGC14_0471670 [marine sediment metagenome]|uniref:Uncharacterized protein n=1 Tax=marine sediment metagenome TaxID=412755 RepID=A0A0F9SC52_9ZZZZ|nr:MAG: hypothetical protein Lokiarch_25340 [Candidatus Lokiarchaeum sp. GC14_75]HEC37610.1 hypothetical protein [bacterium]